MPKHVCNRGHIIIQRPGCKTKQDNVTLFSRSNNVIFIALKQQDWLGPGCNRRHGKLLLKELEIQCHLSKDPVTCFEEEIVPVPYAKLAFSDGIRISKKKNILNKQL